MYRKNKNIKIKQMKESKLMRESLIRQTQFKTD